MREGQGKDGSVLDSRPSLRRLAGSPELLLLVILLIAAFLRFYRLDEIPPGLNRDEAYNGLDALKVLQRGIFPIFFEANEGREPLFIYLQTIATVIWGVQAWTLRLVAGFVGLVTIPLIYKVGAALFSGEKRARWLGVLAAGGLTLSFWHLHASRMGFRAVMLPTLSLLTIWFFWRGWQQGRTRDWVLCGIALGATLYTYTASRFLPFVLLAFLVVQVGITIIKNSRPGQFSSIVERRRDTPAFKGMALLLLATLVTAAPLAVFYIRDPYAFSGHSQSLTVFNPFGPPSPDQGLWRLQENIIAVVRMFMDRGDEYVKNNLPNRPALDWVGALGFWVGVLAAVFRSRRPQNMLLLIWLVIMLLPTILSSDAPNYVRAAGALPPIFLLTAAGLSSMWERLAGRLGWQSLAIGVIVLSGYPTVNDYFNVWGNLPDTYREFDDGYLTSGKQALELLGRYDVAMPVELYARPENQLLFMSHFGSPISLSSPLKTSRPLVYVTTGDIPVRSLVVLLHGGDKGEIVFPGLLDPQTVKSWQEMLDSISTPITSRSGAKVGKYMRPKLPDDNWMPLAPSRSIDASFGKQIRLVGYDLPTTVKPGETAESVLYWQALDDLHQAYVNSIALVDAKGKEWNPFGREVKLTTDLWRRGQITPDILPVPIPTDAPPGKYMLTLKVIRGRSDTPLPVLVPGDENLAQDVTIGPLTVAPPVQPGAPPRYVEVHFGPAQEMSLLGYRLEASAYGPGQPISIELSWKSERTIDADYTVFVHLVDGNGQVVAQHDSQPQDGYAPTSLWSLQEAILDVHTLQLPSDLKPGEYSIRVGLYDLKSGQRLPASTADNQRLGDNSFAIPEPIVVGGPAAAP